MFSIVYHSPVAVDKCVPNGAFCVKAYAVTPAYMRDPIIERR